MTTTVGPAADAEVAKLTETEVALSEAVAAVERELVKRKAHVETMEGMLIEQQENLNTLRSPAIRVVLLESFKSMRHLVRAGLKSLGVARKSLATTDDKLQDAKLKLAVVKKQRERLVQPPPGGGVVLQFRRT